MIIGKGSRAHMIYRALYEASTRRHFIGEILEVEGAVCRMQGFAFVLDPKLATFQRKPEKRMTIADLGENRYIVNVIDSDVDLDNVSYKYERNVGLVATDEKQFALNINEFDTKH